MDNNEEGGYVTTNDIRTNDNGVYTLPIKPPPQVPSHRPSSIPPELPPIPAEGRRLTGTQYKKKVEEVVFEYNTEKAQKKPTTIAKLLKRYRIKEAMIMICLIIIIVFLVVILGMCIRFLPRPTTVIVNNDNTTMTGSPTGNTGPSTDANTGSPTDAANTNPSTESANTNVSNSIVSELSDIKSFNAKIEGKLNDIIKTISENLPLSYKILSCQDIKSIDPNSSSGFYHINSGTVYCNMDQLCGSNDGWTRLGYLDITDHSQSCPSQLTSRTNIGVRTCGRPFSNGASCSPSIIFRTNIAYTEICGKAIGYQFKSTDAINPGVTSIDSHYVDGVSITRGSPRQHVWTLMSGQSDTTTFDGNCPCNNPAVNTPQAFIGSDYFCESGNPDLSFGSRLYTDDPLWDGQGCGPHETACCAAPGLPWFHRKYNASSTDFIEMRICSDESTNNEDVRLSFYEIYIK